MKNNLVRDRIKWFIVLLSGALLSGWVSFGPNQALLPHLQQVVKNSFFSINKDDFGKKVIFKSISDKYHGRFQELF
ncbi:hypothetical protein [Pararhodonellum marinum]|uniref:hypothetical protein n=1 Tax=Pararhodonellum marinum TaxID=2755358 RepID=UPI00188E7CAF|nr:hypothetical protein [Pararhodonellum marinum]